MFKILLSHIIKIYFKIKIKIRVLPPKKSKILIYDYTCVLSGHTKILFKKKSYSILCCRGEEINFFIFLKSIFLIKFFNFKKNYKYHYLNYVKPKIVYTCIDNNPSFYLLKDIYPYATYIADQNGFRDNFFFNYCLDQKKKFKTNYKVDYFFVFGSYEKNRIKKIINGRIIVGGHTINNNILIKNKKKNTKIITYISSKIEKRLELEKKIFNYLIFFSKKFNYKLFFLDRHFHLKNNNKIILKEIFNNNDWFYRNFKHIKDKHNLLQKSQLIIFAHSTLGYECLSKGYKCLALNQNQYNYSNTINFKKNGFYWCPSDNYKTIETKMLKILSYDSKIWTKKLNKFSEKILFFDKNNSKKKKIIKKILNDNK